MRNEDGEDGEEGVCVCDQDKGHRDGETPNFGDTRRGGGEDTGMHNQTEVNKMEQTRERGRLMNRLWIKVQDGPGERQETRQTLSRTVQSELEDCVRAGVRVCVVNWYHGRE